MAVSYDRLWKAGYEWLDIKSLNKLPFYLSKKLRIADAASVPN